MKFIGCLSSWRGRQALAILAGLLWAAAFPRIGWAGLAWVAPGLLLFSAIGESGRVAFGLGYLGGLAHYLASLNWLLRNPFPLGAVSGWLSLSAYLALYPAAWVWLCWKWFPHIGKVQGTHWRQRVLWALACAGVWVCGEMILARFLTGFPWNLLGSSQYRILPLAQLASVGGVYAISFLVVWFSISLAGAGLSLFQRLAIRPLEVLSGPMIQEPGRAELLLGWCGEMLLPLAAVASVAAWGIAQLVQTPPAGPELKVALVQPSIPQTLIWDTKENTNRFRQVVQLSELALSTRPDLLVWPEAAVPDLLRYETNTLDTVTGLARKYGVWMIVGADDAEPSPNAADPNQVDYYNASFLINPAGQLVARYCKRRLVIFGEYVPFQPWLPFLKWFTPVEGGFRPGRGVEPFQMTKAKTAVLICFEDVFPHLVREYVDDDTDFLLNLTNNGWFGDSAAQWQHAANAVFRAIENRLPLVRCTNNGLTCWVDAWGRMREVYFPNTTDIYRSGFKTASIPLRPPGTKRPPTFYRQYGDWFGWGCTGLTALLALGKKWPIIARTPAS